MSAVMLAAQRIVDEGDQPICSGAICNDAVTVARAFVASKAVRDDLVAALTEAERFLDYFANGRTMFVGGGTPLDALKIVRAAIAKPPPRSSAYERRPLGGGGSGPRISEASIYSGRSTTLSASSSTKREASSIDAALLGAGRRPTNTAAGTTAKRRPRSFPHLRRKVGNEKG